jgi:segregation and condensation protein B
MEKKDIFSAIECMLFASGEAVEIYRMAEILEIEIDEFLEYLNEYISELNFRHSGLKVVKINNCVQMVTRSEYHPYVAKILETKAQKCLSQSALETLSIIAYNQPVTKAMIEQVRGVDSYNSIIRLLERDLIEHRGRLDTAGRPMLYGTTDEFLRVFGLEQISELPVLESEVLENIKIDNNLSFDDIVKTDDES